MFDRTYEQLHRKQQQAEQKIHRLSQQKNQAIQQRIKELTSEANSISANHEKSNKNIQQIRQNFEEFKRKNKALYASIYQGARDLDLKKLRLIEDIQRSAQGLAQQE